MFYSFKQSCFSNKTFTDDEHNDHSNSKFPSVYFDPELPQLEFIWITENNVGWALINKHFIPSGTKISKYGGSKLRDIDTVRKRILSGNNKILQSKIPNLWYDGEKSKYPGPYLNHACKCQANCELVFDNNNEPHFIAYFDIPAGTILTFDYNLNIAGIKKLPSMKWFVNYKCTNCK